VKNETFQFRSSSGSCCLDTSKSSSGPCGVDATRCSTDSVNARNVQMKLNNILSFYLKFSLENHFRKTFYSRILWKKVFHPCFYRVGSWFLPQIETHDKNWGKFSHHIRGNVKEQATKWNFKCDLVDFLQRCYCPGFDSNVLRQLIWWASDEAVLNEYNS
jgi:hypothetical protein